MFYLLILYSKNSILSNNRMKKKEIYIYIYILIYLCLLKIVFIFLFPFITPNVIVCLLFALYHATDSWEGSLNVLNCRIWQHQKA